MTLSMNWSEEPPAELLESRHRCKSQERRPPPDLFCTVWAKELLELVAASIRNAETTAPVVVQQRARQQPYPKLHCGISGLLHSLHSAYLSLWHNWSVPHSVDERNLRHNPLSIGKDCWSLACMSTRTSVDLARRPVFVSRPGR